MKSASVLLCVMLVMLGCTTTNQSPSITELSATPSSVAVGGTSVLKVTATDADEDPITFAWQSAAGSLSATSGDSVTWTAPSVEGAYSVSVTADDGRSADADITTITVGRVPKMQISGYAHYSESWAMLQRGSFLMVLSDPQATGVTVSVNGRQLQTRTMPGPTMLILGDTVLPVPGTQQDMSLQCNLGTCAATCTIPGGFAYAPAVVESLPVRTTLVLSWTQSGGANWYEVYASYIWYDTTYWSKDTVFTVTSTSAAIPGTWFVGDGRVYVDVYAGNGPSPLASSGAAGNVTGDAKGFWLGLNSISAEVMIGEGRKATMSRPFPRPQLTPSRWFELYAHGRAVR